MVQLGLMHFLPESPRVLIIRGETDKARQTLQAIYKGASNEIIELKLRIVQDYVESTTRLQRQLSLWDRVKTYWTHKPYRRAIICVSGVQAFGQLT